MKHIYNLLILILFSVSLNGQVLVKENKLWSNTEKGSEGWCPYKSYFIKFSGDTTINGFEYKRILRCEDSLQVNWFVDGYIREDSLKKVFLYPISFNYTVRPDIEVLIYDFNLELGDSILTLYSSDMYIYLDSIGYSKLENSSDSVRVLYFYSSPSKDNNNLEAKWFESIGSRDGVLQGLNALWVVGGYFDFVCYFENDTLKYHNDYFSSCFPGAYPDNIKQLNTLKDNIKVMNDESKLSFDFKAYNTANSKLIIYNIYGSKIKEFELNGDNMVELNKNELQTGIYLYRFQNNNLKLSNKFVIE